jgi:TetR/AcrR family transcriptional regulator
MPARAGRPAATRRRGRPPAAPERDVQRALLDAAREMFLQRGYTGVSVRQLAAAVGVNPAMVKYYFHDKRGLYAAVLREAIGPLAARMDAMLVAPAAESPDLAAFLAEYMRTVAAHPWLPALILRDVLAPDGHFRDRFVQEFAGRVAPKAAELARRGAQLGRMRADLDPRMTVISMLSLGLWPFLAMPVLQRALHFEPDKEAIEQLIEHTVRLFAAGTAAGAKS